MLFRSGKTVDQPVAPGLLDRLGHHCHQGRGGEPRRDVIRSVLRRGIGTGELRPDIDVEVALFMLTGAMISRGKHQPEGISDGFAQRVVDELLTGLTPR